MPSPSYWGGTVPLPGAGVQRHDLDVLRERAARQRQLGGGRDVLHPELVQQALERAVFLVALRVVGHRQDDLRLELMYDLGRLGRADAKVVASDRDERHVDVTGLLEVGGRE